MFYSPNNIRLISDCPGTITIEDSKSIDTAYYIDKDGKIFPLRYSCNELLRETFESIIKHTDSGYDYWSLRDILVFASRFDMKVDKVSFIAMWKYLDYLKSKGDDSFDLMSVKSPNFLLFRRTIKECHSSVSVEYKCDISSCDCKVDNNKKTAIFAGFPGVGKTYTVVNNKKANISMVDVNLYTFRSAVSDTCNDNKEVIEKYVKYVVSLIGIVDVIFIPDDADVLKVLNDKYPKIVYTIIYPSDHYENLYITRFCNDKLKISEVLRAWGVIHEYNREKYVYSMYPKHSPRFLVLNEDHPYITFNDINDAFENDIANSKQDIETR